MPVARLRSVLHRAAIARELGNFENVVLVLYLFFFSQENCVANLDLFVGVITGLSFQTIQ